MDSVNEKRLIKSPDEFEVISTAVEERETIIQMDANTDAATLYTSDPRIVTKIKYLMKNNPEAFEIRESGRDRNNNVTGYVMKFNKNLVNISSKLRTINRAPMSEEQKKNLIERLNRSKN